MFAWIIDHVFPSIKFVVCLQILSLFVMRYSYAQLNALNPKNVQSRRSRRFDEELSNDDPVDVAVNQMSVKSTFNPPLVIHLQPNQFYFLLQFWWLNTFFQTEHIYHRARQHYHEFNCGGRKVPQRNIYRWRIKPLVVETILDFVTDPVNTMPQGLFRVMLLGCVS